MNLRSIQEPSEETSSKFIYILDVNHFIICKLTQNWSHLFFDRNQIESLCIDDSFDSIFSELKRSFMSDYMMQKKRELLNKNGLYGTLLDMKVDLLRQLFENFKEHANKNTLSELMEKDLLILKSMHNVLPELEFIIELIEHLNSKITPKVISH